MAGAQGVPPTAVGPAPTQPQLGREERLGQWLWEKDPAGKGMLEGAVSRALRLEGWQRAELRVPGPRRRRRGGRQSRV